MRRWLMMEKSEKWMIPFTLVTFALITAATFFPAPAQATWHATRTFKLGGDGAWDYITVDEQTHRLFITRTTHTMVVDSDSGKALADIPGQKSAHGVALVPALQRGFISDGGDGGSIVIFDLNTYSVLGKLSAVPDTD